MILKKEIPEKYATKAKYFNCKFGWGGKKAMLLPRIFFILSLHKITTTAYESAVCWTSTDLNIFEFIFLLPSPS